MSEEKSATQELREKLLNEPKVAKELSAEEKRDLFLLTRRKNTNQGTEYIL